MLFGEWIADQRRRRGWSLKRLADAMKATGLTKASAQYIQQVERGEINPDKIGRDKLEALAVVFGLSVDTLLQEAGGAVPYPRSPTLPELRALARGASPVAQQFLADLEEDYAHVSDAAWHTLTQVLQALVAQDRVKQAQERAHRATEDAAADDPPEGMAYVTEGHRGLNGRPPRRVPGC